MVSCPYCGNTISIMSHTNNTYYCPKCGFYFSADPLSNKVGTLNLLSISAADIENNTRIRLPDAVNVARGFYYTDDNINLPQTEGNSLIINAKSITINDGKINIAIDRDNIDKFDVIEINGVRFVKEEDYA